MRVKTNWCRTCGRGSNFGDQLGPRLLALVGIEAVWADPNSASLVTVGSILSKFKPGWRGTVWGTGLIKNTRVSLTKARVVSVRGTLTRDRAGLPKSTPLSEPGVLVGELMPNLRREVTTRELLVPHSVDHHMVERHFGTPVADICGDPLELLRAIASAELVYTSSLHALVAADALGVPHVYEPHEAVIGGDFKFNDYLSAFGETITPGKERLTSRAAMVEAQTQAGAQIRHLRELTY